MILNTSSEMYRYFLSQVRKERTAVFSPERWNKLINETVIDWIKLKLPMMEFNQKRIDDLEAIKVVTDGIQEDFISSIDTNVFPIPYDLSEHRKYMYGVSVSFLVANEISSEDDHNDDDNDDLRFAPGGGVVTYSDLVPGRILRGDNRVVYKRNPYRVVDDSAFVYYEHRGGKIYCTSDEKKYNRMVLEYYSYPDDILYNEKGGPGSPGSFKSIQNKEIVDMAVTSFLEKVSDQRIQTQPALDGRVPK